MAETDRTTWRKHPNVAGPASMLLYIHDHFRTASARLRSQVAEGAGVSVMARNFAPLAEVLHHHHHAEEMMLFPAIARATGVAPAGLVEDHAELMRAIDEVTASFTDDTHRRHVARHLPSDEHDWPF